VIGTAISAILIIEPVAVPVNVAPPTVTTAFRRLANCHGHHGERGSKSNCFKHGILLDLCVRIQIETNIMFWSVPFQTSSTRAMPYFKSRLGGGITELSITFS
jgi:hypothetical protein